MDPQTIISKLKSEATRQNMKPGIWVIQRSVFLSPVKQAASISTAQQVLEDSIGE